VKSPLLFPTNAMQAETPSQKYAMRAQNQTIIMDGNTIFMDGNTIFYLNSGIDIIMLRRCRLKEYGKGR
jgi:hypothetical protein